MRIITVSRQFGSGGRELGHSLAQKLGFDYYDNEIIKMIAENRSLDPQYVEKTLEEGGWQSMPISQGCSLDGIVAVQNLQSNIIAEEKYILEQIAKRGRDCVVVGRSSDAFLHEDKLLRIFVCADMNSRVDRCMKHLRKSEEGMNAKKMERKIRRMDKNRVRTAELFSESKWGKPDNYDIVINTSGCKINDLAVLLADLSINWFDKTEKGTDNE